MPGPNIVTPRPGNVLPFLEDKCNMKCTSYPLVYIDITNHLR